MWINGTAVYYALHLQDFQRFHGSDPQSVCAQIAHLDDTLDQRVCIGGAHLVQGTWVPGARGRLVSATWE